MTLPERRKVALSEADARFLDQSVRAGRYSSREEAIAQALQLLRALDAERELWLDNEIGLGLPQSGDLDLGIDDLLHEAKARRAVRTQA